MLTSATGLNSGVPLLSLCGPLAGGGAACLSSVSHGVMRLLAGRFFWGYGARAPSRLSGPATGLTGQCFSAAVCALLIVMLLGAPTMAVITGDPWEEMAWLGWPLVVAFYFVGLRILEARPHKSFFVLHGTPLWLFVFLGMWSLEALLSDWAAAGDLWSKTALGLMPRLGCCAVGARFFCTPLAAQRLARRLPGFGRRAFDNSRRVVAVPGGHRLPERQLAHGLLTVGESHRYQRRIFATRYIDVASGMCSTFR